MKKKYVKPRVGVDLFSLLQTVSGTCGVEPESEMGRPLQADKYTCGWYMDDAVTLFLIDSAFCTVELEDGDDETYCYNNPSGGTEIFGS